MPERVIAQSSEARLARDQRFDLRHRLPQGAVADVALGDAEEFGTGPGFGEHSIWRWLFFEVGFFAEKTAPPVFVLPAVLGCPRNDHQIHRKPRRHPPPNPPSACATLRPNFTTRLRTTRASAPSCARWSAGPKRSPRFEWKMKFQKTALCPALIHCYLLLLHRRLRRH